MLACSAFACGESVETDRFEAQAQLGRAAVPGAALSIALEPGATPQFRELVSRCDVRAFSGIDVAPFRLGMRASGPTPRITLARGERSPLALELLLSNATSEVVFSPRYSGIPGCEDDGFTGGLFLGPIEADAVSANVQRVCVIVPGCSELDLQAVTRDAFLGIDTAADPLRVAVIGEVDGNKAVLEDALASMLEWEADLLVATGNIANSDAFIELRAFQEAVDASDIPSVVALGPDEISTDANLPFHEVFGRSDFHFVARGVRFLIMDTASAEISDAQFNYWTSQLDGFTEATRVAVMSVPPIDPAGVRNDGFDSRTEAARFAAMLGEGEVDAAFTGGGGTYATNRFAGIPFYSTGGGGGPVESGSAIGNHYLRVTIDSVNDTVSVEAVEL